MKNLFRVEGVDPEEPVIKKNIEVNLYCDEIKNKECTIGKDRWHYFGILIVPVKIEKILLEDLLKKRFLVNNFCDIDIRSKYFAKNNRIVHFHELDADTYYVAKRWHEYMLDYESCDKVYFSILGINQNKLDLDVFGDEDLFNRIYNRFFRAAVVYSLKRFFPKTKICIKEIIHEKGEQEFHEFFPWHVIYKINEDYEDISCSCQRINFFGKDHEKDPRSNFLQLIDVILGATINNFHDSSNKEFKLKLTEDFSELVKRLIKNPDNPNSKYCKDYHRRMNISFFPKQVIMPEDDYYEYKKRLSQFYKEREMVFLSRGLGRLI